MKDICDWEKRDVRFTKERQNHIGSRHPEIKETFQRISETLGSPDFVVQSKWDLGTELIYRHYSSTPVTEKYMCVVVKRDVDSPFIITAYYTDRQKEGEILWTKTK